jgi:hypothetical protein
VLAVGSSYISTPDFTKGSAMFKGFILTAAVLVVTVSAGIWASRTALAAGDIITVDCGSAGTFDISVNGNGDFTPGRILDAGSGVIIPVAVRDIHFEFTDNEGNTQSGSEPDVAKKHVPAKKTIITCSFEATFEDENGHGSFSGVVDAFVVGRR